MTRPGTRPSLAVAVPPAETVTFLFTDVEGSTRLLEEDRAAADRALIRHHELLAAAVDAGGGTVFETVGDAVYASFGVPPGAVESAIAAHRALAAEAWADLGLARPLRVRIALHLGPVERRGHRYFGTPLFAAARLLSLAHGGQTLVSDELASVLAGSLPSDASLRPMGRHRLKDLSTPMLVHQLDAPGLTSEFAPIRSLGVVHLPTQVDAFVGRTVEVAAIRALLSGSEEVPSSRLVTLTGPGGTGKTRLALEASSGLASRFPDGVWWVPLSAVSDPAVVPSAIAAVVGAAGDPAEHLRTWSALLVVDNLEQVIACAPALGDLVARCPSVAVLATSREPLRIAGERVLPVAPLDAPGCVALLGERAAAAAPGTTFERSTADAICAALDRLPLAVELAAARLRLFTPEQLLERLSDRLDAVGHGARDLPDRQRTLRATIAWSVDLLDAAEEDLFERLAVFTGGWTMEAAETICTAEPDVLLGLVDRSLVRREPGGRFGMLETIAAFARERFEGRADAATIRERHLRWFGQRAAELHRAMDHVEPGADTSYMDAIEADAENAWAALVRVTGGRPVDDDAHRVAAGTWRFWIERGRGRIMLELLRPVPWAVRPFSGDPGEDARAGLAELERYFGDPARAIALKLEELAHPATRPPLAAALHADLADLYVRAGELHQARDHARSALALRRSLADRDMEAHALIALMAVEVAGGDVTAGARVAHQVLAILRSNPDQAWFSAELTSEVLPVLVLAGDDEGARAALAAGLRASHQVRSGLTFAILVDSAAGLALRSGDHPLAVRWAVASDAAFGRMGGYRPLVRLGPRVLEDAALQMDATERTVLTTAGRELPLDAAVAEVSGWL